MSEDTRRWATPTIIVSSDLSSYSSNNRRPRETVASCRRPEPGDERGGPGSGRAEERRTSARKPTRVVDAMWETGETWAVGEAIDKRKVLV